MFLRGELFLLYSVECSSCHCYSFVPREGVVVQNALLRSLKRTMKSLFYYKRESWKVESRDAERGQEGGREGGRESERAREREGGRE